MKDNLMLPTLKEFYEAQIPRMFFEGVDIPEIIQVLNVISDEKSWRVEWSHKAEKYLKCATKCEKNNFLASARDMYLKGSICYRLACENLYADNQDKKYLFKKSVDCYKKARMLFSPAIIEIEIPFKKDIIKGYLHLPGDIQQPACVVCVPGVGYCKERFHNWCRLGIQRGMGVVVFDPPGYGESRILKGKFPDAKREAHAIFPVIEYLQKCKKINKDRIGILGYCFGAHSVVKATAIDKRIKACALIEGFYSCKDSHTPKSSVSRFIEYAYGNEKNIQDHINLGMPLEDTDEKIDCPLYIIHDNEDTWVNVTQAFAIYHEANGPKKIDIIKEKKVFSDYNFYRYNAVQDQLFSIIPVVWDWLKENLAI